MAVHDIGDFPCQVKRVLDAGVGPEAVEWGMAMNGIAKTEAEWI